MAEVGNCEAQYQLGFLALTECDLISGREAFSWFRRAAETGHADAMYQLATFPDFSRVEAFESPLSAEEAWSWLVRAAELGCRQAQYDAGAYLATGDWGNGQVVKQNLASAVAWYRLAAEAGHVDAQFNLATMLMNGEGCERDLVAAKTWLKRAMAGGYKYQYAAELLAQMDSLK